MKIVGCDLHAGQQTIAMVDTETGRVHDGVHQAAIGALDHSPLTIV